MTAPMAAAGPTIGPRIGVDLGGTKIEGLLLDSDGQERARHRVATPRNDYAATIGTIAGLVTKLETAVGDDGNRPAIPVGIGMPGSIAPGRGLET